MARAVRSHESGREAPAPLGCMKAGLHTDTRAHTRTQTDRQPCRWTGPGMDSQTVPEVRREKEKGRKRRKKLLVEGEEVQQEKSYSWSTCMIPARGPQEQENVITVTLVCSKERYTKSSGVQTCTEEETFKSLTAQIVVLPNQILSCC